MDAALLRYEQTVLIALEETENALFGFTSARTRQARLEVAAEASQEAADLARLRYRGRRRQLPDGPRCRAPPARGAGSSLREARPTRRSRSCCCTRRSAAAGRRSTSGYRQRSELASGEGRTSRRGSGERSPARACSWLCSCRPSTRLSDRAHRRRRRRLRLELAFVLTFSGGGTRAAAFAYGVLAALRDIEVEFDGADAGSSVRSTAFRASPPAA